MFRNQAKKAISIKSLRHIDQMKQMKKFFIPIALKSTD